MAMECNLPWEVLCREKTFVTVEWGRSPLPNAAVRTTTTELLKTSGSTVVTFKRNNLDLLRQLTVQDASCGSQRWHHHYDPLHTYRKRVAVLVQ